MIIFQKIVARIFYFYLWFLGAFFYYMPFSLKSFMAKVLASIWYYLCPFRVTVILHNLALVFPRHDEESMSDFEKRSKKLARANLHHMCLLFFESLERFHWKRSDLGKRAIVYGLQPVIDRCHSGQGSLLLTSHMGNWELGSHVATLFGLPASVITRNARNPISDFVLQRYRRGVDIEYLPEIQSGLKLRSALKRGRAMAFMFDQHTGSPHGQESVFLGQKAWSPKGLALIAVRLKAPIVPIYFLRNEQGQLELHTLEDLDFPDLEAMRAESSKVTDRILDYHIRRCNESIGKWVRKYPEQYLWMHKRFKNFLDYRSPLPWQ